jgi:hypothetical protein
VYFSDISPDFLRETHLIGVELSDENGNPYPDVFYKAGINRAKAWIQHELHLYVQPETIVGELHDYYASDWKNWGFLKTYFRPVTSVSEIRIQFPSNNIPIKFPTNWYQVWKRQGHIQLIPTATTLGGLAIGGSGQLLAVYQTIADYLPGVIQIDYVTGFEEGALPDDIGNIICQKATFDILNSAGDLVGGGPGIANFSVSADALSSSVGTTSSPTNAGYGARLINLQREIKMALANLKEYYQGLNMVVV